jgi:predicted HD phosphohydrolase
MGQISKFFKSLSISFTKSEIEFVRKYLKPQEQILFYRMPVADQKHAIEIAQILESRAKDQTGINTKELIQAGLLHDLGKCFYPFSLRDRVLGSLLRQFLPPAYESLARNRSVI